MSRGRVLITGASSGIGEAFARQFADEDFDLVLTARREDRLAQLQAELDVEADVIVADLSSEAGISALISAIDKPVDILVNNAGQMTSADFENLNDDEVQATITLNVMAVTRLTHHFLGEMKARQSGRILNVASVAAFHPVPGMDLYAATKAFVLSLTESLAENLRGSGVSVTALCPGLTDTEGVDRELAETLPPFMLSTPEEVAREGFDALMAREVIRVPGGANKAALTWAQHQPRWLIRGLGGLASRIRGR